MAPCPAPDTSKMVSILLLASLAISIASCTAHNGAHSLRLPIRRQESWSIETRDDPGYGPNPLRANITQRRDLSPYTLELAIGTPPQVIYTALDVFSDSLWLNPDCHASISPETCCANGKYDPNISTTARPKDCSYPWEFSAPYGSVSGCNIEDNVQFAGVNLGIIQVGIANKSWGLTAGRFGLGFGCHPASDITLLDVLKIEGLITTRQFSIALGGTNSPTNDPDNSAVLGEGELLFSGVNTGKYAGELQKMRSHSSGEGDSRFYVNLLSIGLSDPRNCRLLEVTLPQTRAFFDFGTVLSYLPRAFLDDVSDFFPDSLYNSTEGVYEVPCYHRTQDASIDFYFDGVAISVPMRDFILEMNETCYLGVTENQSNDEIILGQSFLKGAYTAFDADNETIYMAQYENCGNLIIEWDPNSTQQEGLCASKPYHFTLDEMLNDFSAVRGRDVLNSGYCPPEPYESVGVAYFNEFLSNPSKFFRVLHKAPSNPHKDSFKAPPNPPNPHKDSFEELKKSHRNNTGRWTPKPTISATGTSSAELSTLTSIAASGSKRPSQTPRPGGGTHSHAIRASAEKTVTVTVGVVTSTVFMPSPITVPVTCHCPVEGTVTHLASLSSSPSSCRATTEYRTLTITKSHCSKAKHTTTETPSKTAARGR
ncbi:acid protease [Xylaria nigripes]|nr:acid protease [Xylaria nigripes]